MKLYPIRFMLIAVSCLSFFIQVSAGEEGLANRFDTETPEETWRNRIMPEVEDSPLAKGGESLRTLKTVQAYGTAFTGRITLRDAVVKKVSMWCEDANLSPPAGDSLFEKAIRELSAKFGKGSLVTAVPSFDGASEEQSRVMLWVKGDDVLALSLTIYPTRSHVSIVRDNKDSWLKDMGADGGDFWKKKLRGMEEGRPATSLDNRTSEAGSHDALVPPKSAAHEEPKDEMEFVPTELPRIGRSTSPFSGLAMVVAVIVMTILMCCWFKRKGM